MSKDGKKSISVEVSKECWKKIKILSIQKEISFTDQVVELLEKSVSKKLNEDVV